MDEMIAFCGLNCGKCLAFIATQKDDDNERVKVAELWSKQFNADIKPEDINCEGCLSETGRLFTHCKVCEIRKCGLERHVENCAYCGDYACEKLSKFIDVVPEAKLTLEEIRKSRIKNKDFVRDEFQTQFGWITDMLKRPISDFFKADSTEYEILTLLKNGWGTRDTAELLKKLTSEYGDVAGRAVEKYLELNILKDWAEIGKKEAHEGTEIEDFIRVLWAPLKEQGFEFTMKCEKGMVTFCVTRCPIHDLAEKTGMHRWLYHLACSTDFHSAPAFSSKIGFTRTKTLIQGHECCDHQYYYRADG